MFMLVCLIYKFILDHDYTDNISTKAGAFGVEQYYFASHAELGREIFQI